MKIIILGAGQVGSSVAENLASEFNDITVVDCDPLLLQELRDRLDIDTVTGHASHPEVLRRAGAEDADMIIALTNSDEVNMVACQVAYTLFHTPTKIARVRSGEYLMHQKLFVQEALPIDVLISPEQLVTQHVERLINNPGALQVLDFAGARVQLVAVRAYHGGPLVGHELRELHDHMPTIDARVAAIFRRGKPILPEGDTVIEVDDEVFFIAAPQHIRKVMSELRELDKPVKRVMLAGGGHIGMRLAERLESQYQVKIIERNPERARMLSERLKNSIVLLGDTADEELLLEENIENTDVFCAMTNDEEANILSSMLAKRLGARKVMSLINRASYVELVQSEAIDIALSPQQATIGSLLTHVRRGDVVAVHSLRRGAAEAIEAVAHGDKSNSKVVGRAIEDIKLPPGTTIGAVVRGDEVMMAHHDTVIENNDHVILFLVDKSRIPEVEKALPGWGYFSLIPMQFTAILRILGLLLMVFSTTLIPPMLVSLFYKDGALTAFADAFGIILVTGFFLWMPVRSHFHELRLRDGFIVVAMFWLVLGAVGAVPFMLSEYPVMSVTDSFFESLSGLTTTGATVITGIDYLPKSILFYRQELQWLGGMGIIVLAVAVLPMLGIGGMQLYRAETPGPMKDNKLTPRITETAKALWYIYLTLTVACGLGYWVAGMEPFDAIAHSFSTVAIGGFSTHDASIGYFQNELVELVAVVFMLLSGMNFAIHFMAWRYTTIKPYLMDSEVRTYLTLMALVSTLAVVYLYATKTFSTWGDALHHGVFQVVSIGTTTGFTTTDYFAWPGFLPVLLLFVSFVGGCAGSTGGGMKVIRFLLLLKQGMREITRLVHPSAQIPVKINDTPMSDRVVDSVWGFFASYIAAFAVMMLVLMAVGLDQVTAFSAVAACINNLGPGLGDVGSHYGDLPDVAKWVLCAAMLLGRLEIFTILVLLSPAFWRR